MTDGNGPLNFILGNERAAAWVFRLVMLVGILWASNNFVSKTSYERDLKEAEGRRELILRGIGDVNQTLVRIDEKMKNDARQDGSIADHESRIRVIEHAKDNR